MVIEIKQQRIPQVLLQCSQARNLTNVGLLLEKSNPPLLSSHYLPVGLHLGMGPPPHKIPLTLHGC